MQNKICLITGANSGIGKVAALELAKKGMTILMVCRNAQKGEAARQEIIAASGNPQVRLFLCDLANQESIVQLAVNIRQQNSHLDVLVNNAGLIIEKRTVTSEGLEATFAINHLAPFLLTHLLLGLLRKGQNSRVVTVSSEAHRMAKLNWEDLHLQAEKKYSSIVAYADSKLANILFTKKLAALLREEGITANCLHPGVVGTGFGSGFNGGLARLALALMKPFVISAEKGAETTVFLASSPEVQGVSGLYFVRKKPKQPAEAALSQYNADRLWEISRQLTYLDERLAEVNK